MAFCLSIFNSRKEAFYLPALTSMTIILKKYENLANQISIDQVRRPILEIIRNQCRPVSNKALLMLQQIVYHGKGSCDIFLKKMDLPNILYDCLREEVNKTDEFSHDNIANISDIICSLTQTKIKELK